jgi:cytochrome c2
MRYAGILILSLTMILSSILIFAAAGDPENGKEVYAKQKCKLCHSIAGQGNKKSPLDGVGGKLNEADMTKWITAPKEMKADSKMKAYSKLSEKELGDLVAYLMTLKK